MSLSLFEKSRRRLGTTLPNYPHPASPRLP